MAGSLFVGTIAKCRPAKKAWEFMGDAMLCILPFQTTTEKHGGDFERSTSIIGGTTHDALTEGTTAVVEKRNFRVMIAENGVL